MRWQTTQSPGTPACVKAAVVNLPLNGNTSRPAQIVAPSLLQPICSQVAFATYAMGPTFGDDDSDVPSTTAPELALTSGLPTYHPGESFILHAQFALPASSPVAPFYRCPPFLVRQRAFDGSTRLDE